MKIQVLGSGCPTCHRLFELTQTAVRELGWSDEVEYITDIQKIIEMGVMQSPVVAVDGKPILVGYVPKLDALKDALAQTLEHKKSGCCQSTDCDCGSGCC